MIKNKNDSVLSLTIITPTYNNESGIEKFLQSIARQKFPHKKLELLIVDGGSKDRTLQIVKKYQKKLPIRIINNPHTMAEPGVDLGMSKAKGDLMMIIAVDNIYPKTDDLMTIVKTFNNPKVFGAFPKQDSDSTDNLFTKYHNTFTDPFNHFVYGDAANARTLYRVYPTLEHNDIYDIYDYSVIKAPPMIAFAQGFTVRRSYRRGQDNRFDDCRSVIELIEQNKKIAYVHAVSLIHHTTRDVGHFIRKQRWATYNALNGNNYGIAHRVDKLSTKQKVKMIIWPLYAFSFFIPLAVAIAGAVRDRRAIWLFHPLIAWLSAFASLEQILLYNIKKIRSPISRQ